MPYVNYGVIPSPPDERDYPIRTIAPPVALPSEVRLDDRIVKVLTQGRCGTCVGKGCNAILSAGHRKALSSLYIYSRSKDQDGIPELEGTYPRVALKVMQKEGSCPDEVFPYSMLRDCFNPPKATVAMTGAATPYRIKAYARVWSIIEMKQALAAGHLCAASFWVGDNWTYYNGGVIQKTNMQNLRGLHLVVVCGYSDTLKAFRGLNSWGAGWGDKGFFWISYDTFQGGSDFTEGWAVEVESIPKPDYMARLFALLKRLVEALQVFVDKRTLSPLPKRRVKIKRRY